MQVWQGEERLALVGPRQLTLFAFLVVHANRAISRDALTDAVWGPARSDGGNRLQMAIARLRKALEPLNVESGVRLQTVKAGYLLSIAPGELDADAFQVGVQRGTSALDAGAPAQAADVLYETLALWRGPPLAEVAFEDFAQSEIRRLEELRIRALECRINAELQLGRHAELIGELEGLLLQAPTREHVAGQLMLALYRCGRQADALDVYQRVRSALSAQLGLDPGPALKTLQMKILEHAASLELPAGRQGSPSGRRSGAAARAPIPTRLHPYGPSVFADRRREHDTLARALNEAASSGRQAAFVTGEAGIGKTRLVSEFARDAHAAGALVVAGRCDDGLNLPYQPFVEALEHLVAHTPTPRLKRHITEYGGSIARLVPALSAHAGDAAGTEVEPSESERYVLFRAIEGLLSAECEDGPVLLVLEDLHWADLPTLHLLRRLLTSARSWALMVVSTCRLEGLGKNHPLRELLADLHREPRVLRLSLTGLDSADVGDLLRGIGEVPLATADQQLAETLEASTNGNPFFITQLVQGLAETGALVSDEGRVRLTDGVELTSELPVSITETLGRRLRRMHEDVRRCLDVAAVVGQEFDAELVSAVADVPSASDALTLAVEDGVLLEVPDQPARLRFAHALMQRYVYRQLGPARQTELHRRIALAMEDRSGHDGSTFAELARHWMGAADADVETALRYSVLAGDEALGKLAPDEGRRWYEGALELLGGKYRARDTQRCELLIKRGEAERQAGDLRFRETLLEAAEIAQRIGDEDKLVRAALGNTRGMQSETGIVDEGRVAALDSALRIVGQDATPERARLLAIQAAELMYSQEWNRRVRLSDEALAIARELDDADALGTVLNMRFVTLLAPETLAERRANTVEAVAVAEGLSDPLLRFFAYHWRTYACIEAGDMLGARSWAAREQDIADRFRQPTTMWLRRADEANLAIVAGKLDLAAELSTAALEIGRHSEPDALACYAAQQTSTAFESGRLGELIPLLEQAVQDNPGVPGFRAPLALSLTEVSRPEEARNLIDQAAASSFREIPYDVTWLAVTCIYALVTSRLGDVAAATTLYRMLEPWSEQIAFPAFGVWGPVSLYLGSLSLVLDNRDAAERHFLAAGRAATRAGAPLWQARATGQLGQLG
jgi:DNA-binding SARP family transcriptional activator